MAKRRTLRAIRPSAALGREYKKKLQALVTEMQRSVFWWLRAAYRKREEQIAADAGPARSLAEELDAVMRGWQKEYDEAAQRIARWFVSAAARHVGYATKEAFRAAKVTKLMTVNFKYMSRKERDVMQAIIIQNVSLIKSIPSQYLTEVQGILQRSVENGRDLGYMTKELHERAGITMRRAATIAMDQNNKVTESLSRWRMLSLGVTEGVWQHYPIGKTYRDAHVHMDGEVFKLAEGLYDEHEGRKVKPGELVNCHCSYKAIIPDFTKGAENENAEG